VPHITTFFVHAYDGRVNKFFALDFALRKLLYLYTTYEEEKYEKVGYFMDRFVIVGWM
jgi:hypothetical protein